MVRELVTLSWFKITYILYHLSYSLWTIHIFPCLIWLWTFPQMTNFLSSSSQEVKILAGWIIHWAEETSVEYSKVIHRIILQFSWWAWSLNATIYGSTVKHKAVLNYHWHQGRHAVSLCGSAGFTDCLLSAVARNREQGCQRGTWEATEYNISGTVFAGS